MQEKNIANHLSKEWLQCIKILIKNTLDIFKKGNII